MGRSLLFRLLAVSLGVASLAVIATALLATYGAGTRLREELENDRSLLEADSYIRSSLLAYASNHDSWDGVETLVRDLAEETGRRIALTSPDGRTIADSSDLLDQRAGELPSTPAAQIDAVSGSREPTSPAQFSELSSGPRSTSTWQTIGSRGLSYYGWQLTEAEQRERQILVEEAEECLSDKGVDASVQAGSGLRGGGATGLFLTATSNDPPARADDLWASDDVQACIPENLYAPSDVAREINEQAVELLVACLDELDLTFQVSEDSYGMRVVEPAEGGRRTAAWEECQQTSEAAAMQPYVAPPAGLYLGTSERFDPFSPDSWWRTAGTVAAVLVVAAVVTVFAGRRLVRPIVALTGAAERMKGGDRTARVPVTVNDEVGRLADAFNGMAESIEQSDHQRRALVSDVAHELRTPLANVRTHLEAVDAGVAPLDASLVESLREESALLERLVSDLQDLALADAGMLRIHPEERDAADIAVQAVAAHRAQAEAAGVAVRVNAPDPMPVYADPARLRQALGNLVSNAVTHTPSGGTVDVLVRQVDGDVLLAVTDTGEGIAAEHLPYVFDRFYRADPSRSRTTGGSGLGLAIAKHLVEAHDGLVDVTSTPGEGSTFTIHLRTSPR